MESSLGDLDEQEGLLVSFTNPSTFPHILLMIFLSAILYALMKSGMFGLEENGSVIFLSLTISYILIASANYTFIGKIFNVDDQIRGVFNFQYLKLSLLPLFFVGIFGFLVLLMIKSQTVVDEENITVFMGSIFLLMSIGQSISIIAGSVNISNQKKIEIRAAKTGGLYSSTRVLTIGLIFGPLIWFLGYSAEETGGPSEYVTFSWLMRIMFLIFLIFIVIFMDRFTSDRRVSSDVDGKARDRFMMMMLIFCSWHLFSSWRRSPLSQQPSSSSILIEELLLMALSIILAVWSISKKGKKKGWKIFQGRSAIFWGISFGYAYAGSVSSLSSIGEGRLDLVTITGLGHLITAICILLLMPMSISLVGNLRDGEEVSGEGTVNTMDRVLEVPVPDIPKADYMAEEISYNIDDEVELVD